MEEKKYPIGGYAPGNYTCKCCICKQEFQGDKRAVQCEPCALEARARFDALTPEQQMDMIKRNGQIANVLFSTPVSPERDLILRIVEQWGNAIEMPKMEQWLKDYAGKKQPGAVWVKASTRLPNNPDDPFNHFRLHGRKVNGNFYQDSDGMMFFEVRGSTYEPFQIGWKSFQYLEWLDESGTAAAGREGSLTQPRADLIREANNRDLDGVGSEAVEFAEWIRENHILYLIANCGDMWADYRLPIGQHYLTTAQLYELFKQQKEK